MACIVPRAALTASGSDALTASGRDALARSVLEFCLQRLAYFKAPGYVAFCESLPLTPTEKIQRARLKDLAHALRSTSATIDLRALKKRPGNT